MCCIFFFFFKQKTAYEMRISDWSSDVCSSDLQAKGKAVVAHLGSGASVCAMEDCVSRDTSMGFSTLDGIPMATRCGALDAGVVLHLAKIGHDPGEIGRASCRERVCQSG